MRAESGARIEPNRLGQPGLAFIEGPEALRLQLQRTGNMQRVQRTHAESGSVAPGKIGTCFPYAMRKLNRSPQAREVVALEFSAYFLRFNESKPFQKDLLINSVCQFRVVEGRDPDGEAEIHALVYTFRMRIRDVARNQKARINVSVQ